MKSFNSENIWSLAGMGRSSASITEIAELGLKTQDLENVGVIIPIFISFSKKQKTRSMVVDFT